MERTQGGCQSGHTYPGDGMVMAAHAGPAHDVKHCLSYLVAAIVAATCATQSAGAQTDVWAPRADTVTMPSLPRTSDSLPRFEDESLRGYLWQTLGPVTLLRAAALGGIDQARDRPPEWARDAHGYAQRAGSHLAAAAISTSVRFGLDALLQQRSGLFVACTCTNWLLRLRHAAATPIRAYGRGGWTTSALTPLTELGSALLVTTVRPGGFNARDGLRNGAMGVASLVAVSVVHEFWPWPWSLRERWVHRLPRVLQGVQKTDSTRTRERVPAPTDSASDAPRTDAADRGRP